MENAAGVPCGVFLFWLLFCLLFRRLSRATLHNVQVHSPARKNVCEDYLAKRRRLYYTCALATQTAV